MAMGVNAHVNNDLGQSLRDIITDSSFKEDFDKVNAIIEASISQVIRSLHESSLLLDEAEKTFISLYEPYLYILIKNWRKNAWEIYMSLKNNSMNIEEIELKAFDLAQNLTALKDLKGLQNLIRIIE